MKTILTYTCRCGEDMYEDDEICLNCGAAVDPAQFEQQEIAEVTKEVVTPPRLMLPASAVTPGHLAIINHYDRPCVRLLVYLHTVTPEMATGYYLSTDVAQDEANGLLGQVTPLEHFGMRAILSADCSRCLLVYADYALPHRAQYPNSRRRNWQPESYDHNRTHIKVNMVPLLLEGAVAQTQ